MSSAFLSSTPPPRFPASFPARQSLQRSRRLSPLRRHYPFRPRHPFRPQQPPVALAQAAAAPNGAPEDPHTHWRTFSACDVLLPPAVPRLVIFFIGGFVAGASAPTFYSRLLTRLSLATQAAVIAYRLPPVPSPNHAAIASSATSALLEARDALPVQGASSLPALGIGHSLGAKLLLLAATLPEKEARLPVNANALLALSNAASVWPGFSDALRALDEGVGSQGFDVAEETLRSLRLDDAARRVSEARRAVQDAARNAAADSQKASGGSSTSSSTPSFYPNADETLSLVAARYSVPRTLFVRFSDDSLDNSEDVLRVLRSRFGQTAAGKTGSVLVREMRGSHVTPLTPDFDTNRGGFFSLGREDWDAAVRNRGKEATDDLNALLTVLAAYSLLVAEDGSTGDT